MTFIDGWNFQLGRIVADLVVDGILLILCFVAIAAILFIANELDNYKAKRGRWKIKSNGE